jgi:hypothetical protein
MTERFAIYYAPARESALWQKAQSWLAQPDLADLTVSARRYGFHATLKAPMTLKARTDWAELRGAIDAFAQQAAPVDMGRLGAHLLDGFLALTPVHQPQALTDFAATVVVATERYRQPLDAAERARRLKAPLTPRQVELVDQYGYPYVFEQFQFHMTLTDRMPADRRDELQQRAATWFADELSAPIMLDRLVVFHEAAPGEPFVRLNEDFVLRGRA